MGAFNISLNHPSGRGREHAGRGRTSARKCIADVTNVSTSKTCLLRRPVSVRILSLFRIFLRLFAARKKGIRRKTGHTLRRSIMLTLHGSTIESLSSKRSWGHERQEFPSRIRHYVESMQMLCTKLCKTYVNQSYIALTRSYVVSIPGIFFCIENAMFSLVKRNLLESYAVFKGRNKGGNEIFRKIIEN